MAEPPLAPPSRGLDRTEKLLFGFGVLAIGVLLLAFGQGSVIEPLPVAAVWIVAGVGFIWWFDRHLAHRRD